MISLNVFDKKNSFDKKYSMFSKYIVDESVRQNMIDNQDLFRKYNTYSSSIEVFLIELAKRFDVVTINKIIIDAIVKCPDEMMISLITSYLNSDEATKTNSEFVTYFNKTSSYGKDSVKYIEENGLVTNRNYKDIPNFAIDNKFNELYKNPITFKGEDIKKVFETLSYPERKYLNSLLENGSLSYIDNSEITYLEKVFDRFDVTLKQVIKLCINRIDPIILKKEVINAVGAYELMIYSCLILEVEDYVKINDNIKYIVAKNRLDLFRSLILYNRIIGIKDYSIKNIDETSDYDILNSLKEDESVLVRKVEKED